MPEVLSAATIISFVLLLLWATIPKRPARAERAARAVNANHHGLYLLVNDLVTTQKRGYLTVFPDEESYQEAQRLLAGYREQITTTGPPLHPGPDPTGLIPEWRYSSGPDRGPNTPD